MPDVLEPPAAPANLNPELAKLFQVQVADEPAAPETEPSPVDKPPEKEPSAAPPEEKKPDEVKPESRLAPDFAEPKKADVPAEQPIKITDEMIESAKTPKAQADMRKFRESYEKLEKEVSDLRTKASALPTEDTETKTLYEAVKKERDDLLGRIERANLYESPKFQQEHLIPRQKQFDRLSSIVTQAGGDATALQRAMSLTGKGRIEALDEIRGEIGSEMLKGQFDRLVEDIDSRTADINEKVRNAKQTAQELQKAELLTREEQHSKLTKEYEGLLSHALRDTSENIAPELFTKVDDPKFAWWNETIDRDNQVAREALLESTPQKAAYAAVFASKLGTVLQMWRAERAANKAKDEEIAALKGAEPTLTVERTPTKTDTEKSDPDSILERLRGGAYRK